MKIDLPMFTYKTYILSHFLEIRVENEQKTQF